MKRSVIHRRALAWVLPTLLVAVAAAGCTGTPADPVPPECTHPTWTLGKSTGVYQTGFARTGIGRTSQKNDTLGANLLTFQDDPLDRIELDFHWERRGDEWSPRFIEVQNGTLHAEFFDDEGRILQAYQGIAREEARHLWTWEPGVYTNFTMTVELSPAMGIPDPRAVVVEWSFDRRPVTGAEPRDLANMWYKANYWYRSCTPDA